jgi:hypothetical protein
MNMLALGKALEQVGTLRSEIRTAAPRQLDPPVEEKEGLIYIRFDFGIRFGCCD